METQFRILNERELEVVFSAFDAFVQAHKHFELCPSQKRFAHLIIKSVLNNEGKSIAIEFSRQGGKTEGLTLTIDYLDIYYSHICEKYGLPNTGSFNVSIYAPQKEQAKTDFDRIKDFLNSIRDADYDFELSEFNGTTIKLRGEKQMPIDNHCFSASITSRTESKTNNLIILEEVQDMFDKKIGATILPTGAHTNATVVYNGTAGYRRCQYHTLLETLPDDQKVIADCNVIIAERREMFGKTNNPIYLNYEKYIEKQKRELGENSDEFKTQYLLQWVLSRGQFIQWEEVEALEAEYLESTEVYHTFGSGMTLYGGLDLGMQNDSTVLTIMTGDGKIVYWKEMLGSDYPTQVMIIKEIIRNRFKEALKCLRVDSTGNQDSTVSMLKYALAEFGTQVIGVNFSAQSKDFMFKNLSALMKPIIVNNVMIKKPYIKIPKTDSEEKSRFMTQFCNLQKEIKNGLWHCCSPVGAGYHDDYPCSLALAALGIKSYDENKRWSFTVA